MILVALAVVLSTAFGVLAERRTPAASRLSRGILTLMLYVLVPFVSYTNIAHLHITLGGGAGLLLAYAALIAAGALTWGAGRFILRLPRRELGALICAVILVNTGYLGLPMSVVLLGSHALGSAIAYDQLVSGPMLLIGGFGVGAWFGAENEDSLRTRARAFILRNPPLLAVVAGLIVPTSLAPQPLVTASHVVVVVLLLLGFFTVGVNLSAERREDHAPLLERPDARVGVAMLLRFTVTPLALGAASAVVVHLPRAYLLQAAMPSGINGLIVGHAYRLDQRLSATVIVWSTTLVLIVALVAVLV